MLERDGTLLLTISAQNNGFLCIKMIGNNYKVLNLNLFFLILFFYKRSSIYAYFQFLPSLIQLVVFSKEFVLMTCKFAYSCELW